MVYGIYVAKVGRRIRISSIWTRQTVVLNFRASVSLECMSSPDGECRSVSYGVMNIRKSVAIVRKCKMGGCEYLYLAMTWATPIHSKIGLNKPPKRRKWVFFSIRFAQDPARNENILLKLWIRCTRICKLRLKNGFSSIIEKRPSNIPRSVFFEYKVHDRFASHEWSPINCP